MEKNNNTKTKDSISFGVLMTPFIVKWYSDKPVYEPVIEAIMIGNEKSGISFKSYGRPLMKQIE